MACLTEMTFDYETERCAVFMCAFQCMCLYAWDVQNWYVFIAEINANFTAPSKIQKPETATTICRVLSFVYIFGVFALGCFIQYVKNTCLWCTCNHSGFCVDRNFIVYNVFFSFKHWFATHSRKHNRWCTQYHSNSPPTVFGVSPHVWLIVLVACDKPNSHRVLDALFATDSHILSSFLFKVALVDATHLSSSRARKKCHSRLWLDGWINKKNYHDKKTRTKLTPTAKRRYRNFNGISIQKTNKQQRKNERERGREKITESSMELI